MSLMHYTSIIIKFHFLRGSPCYPSYVLVAKCLECWLKDSTWRIEQAGIRFVARVCVYVGLGGGVGLFPWFAP